MEDMEEQEIRAFSWTSLFFVTGVSCLVFCGILSVLDETYSLFLRLGMIGVGLGLLSLLNQWLGKKIDTGRSRAHSEQELNL